MSTKKPNPKAPEIDRRVVFCTIHNGEPSFLAYGDGDVRVYADEGEIDGRLKLGDPEYKVVRTAEEFKALCAEYAHTYDGPELLVRLTAAKRAFPQYRYDRHQGG